MLVRYWCLSFGSCPFVSFVRFTFRNDFRRLFVMARPYEHQKKNMTQQQVAKMFGVTRQQIGRIERKALNKMREALEADPEIMLLVDEGLRCDLEKQRRAVRRSAVQNLRHETWMQELWKSE